MAPSCLMHNTPHPTRLRVPNTTWPPSLPPCHWSPQSVVCNLHTLASLPSTMWGRVPRQPCSAPALRWRCPSTPTPTASSEHLPPSSISHQAWPQPLCGLLSLDCHPQLETLVQQLFFSSTAALPSALAEGASIGLPPNTGPGPLIPVTSSSSITPRRHLCSHLVTTHSCHHDASWPYPVATTDDRPHGTKRAPPELALRPPALTTTWLGWDRLSGRRRGWRSQSHQPPKSGGCSQEAAGGQTRVSIHVLTLPGQRSPAAPRPTDRRAQEQS